MSDGVCRGPDDYEELADVALLVRELTGLLYASNPTASELRVWTAIVCLVGMESRTRGAITRRTIARQANMLETNVTKAIRRLEAKGLLKWTSGGAEAGGHRRVSFVELLDPARQSPGPTTKGTAPTTGPTPVSRPVSPPVSRPEAPTALRSVGALEAASLQPPPTTPFRLATMPRPQEQDEQPEGERRVQLQQLAGLLAALRAARARTAPVGWSRTQGGQDLGHVVGAFGAKRNSGSTFPVVKFSGVGDGFSGTVTGWSIYDAPGNNLDKRSVKALVVEVELDEFRSQCMLMEDEMTGRMEPTELTTKRWSWVVTDGSQALKELERAMGSNRRPGSPHPGDRLRVKLMDLKGGWNGPREIVEVHYDASAAERLGAATRTTGPATPDAADR
jgi:DNA-binding MarR family transcriptional regulator